MWRHPLGRRLRRPSKHRGRQRPFTILTASVPMLQQSRLKRPAAEGDHSLNPVEHHLPPPPRKPPPNWQLEPSSLRCGHASTPMSQDPDGQNPYVYATSGSSGTTKPWTSSTRPCHRQRRSPSPSNSKRQRSSAKPSTNMLPHLLSSALSRSGQRSCSESLLIRGVMLTFLSVPYSPVTSADFELDSQIEHEMGGCRNPEMAQSNPEVDD